MRISDWSSDVCSSDRPTRPRAGPRRSRRAASTRRWSSRPCATCARLDARESGMTIRIALAQFDFAVGAVARNADRIAAMIVEARDLHRGDVVLFRSEEHTSELQSLMRISYAVFCLKKKNTNRLLRRLN